MTDDTPRSPAETRSREKLKRMIIDLIYEDHVLMAHIMDEIGWALGAYPLKGGVKQQLHCAAYEIMKGRENQLRTPHQIYGLDEPDYSI